MINEKAVETSRGQALAEEYGIKFFETSAKNNSNVVEAFTAIATDIKKRLMDSPAQATKDGVVLNANNTARTQKPPCCSK